MENNISTSPELKETTEMLKRSEQLTILLVDYVINHRRLNNSKIVFKYIFFFLVCLSFFGIISFGSYVVVIVVCKEHVSLYDLGVVISCFVSILSCLIILPNIIASHLFPVSGDATNIDLVKIITNLDIAPRDNFPEYEVESVDNAPL